MLYHKEYGSGQGRGACLWGWLGLVDTLVDSKVSKLFTEALRE